MPLTPSLNHPKVFHFNQLRSFPRKRPHLSPLKPSPVKPKRRQNQTPSLILKALTLLVITHQRVATKTKEHYQKILVCTITRFKNKELETRKNRWILGALPPFQWSKIFTFPSLESAVPAPISITVMSQTLVSLPKNDEIIFDRESGAIA